MGCMIGAQKLLEMWYDKAGKSYAGMQPSESSPLGMLMNYMVNPANSVADRWNTFADYAQQVTSPSEQQMVIAGIISTHNDAEDAELAAWRWSSSDQDAAVNAMVSAAKPDEYKAYNTLATYQYNGKTLPIKVGAGVALQFITKIS